MELRDMPTLIRYGRSERIEILRASSSGSGGIRNVLCARIGYKILVGSNPLGFKPIYKYLNLDDKDSSELRYLDNTRVRLSASVK